MVTLGLLEFLVTFVVLSCLSKNFVLRLKMITTGNMLSFLVGDKHAFEVSIADVSQTQISGKNDVVLEFHVDDTANEVGSVQFEVPSSVPLMLVFSIHSKVRRWS